MMTVNARSEVTGGAACGCRVLRCSCVILTFLASFTVFVRFDFCTSDLRSSCCLGMTILSWLAKRAAIVSLRSNAPKLDAVTKHAVWPVTPPWQPSRWTQTLRPAEVRSVPHRPSEVDDVIRRLPVDALLLFLKTLAKFTAASRLTRNKRQNTVSSN